ncbi:hypothetical protein [Peribacillus deserti]|nr:hypothetical protein [Peribacillus deserti]
MNYNQNEKIAQITSHTLIKCILNQTTTKFGGNKRNREIFLSI